MHELMATTLDTIIGEIRRIKDDARRKGFTERSRWPTIVLRTPRGWTCPKEIDGRRTEGYWRSHQARMIFDSQVKRIHEYKRQLLNALRVVVLYNRLRQAPDVEMAPRTFLFAGKAAPAYHLAKVIIKFLNNLAGTIDGDPAVRGPPRGRVPARVLRVPGRAADPRDRRLQPDLDRGLRGERHEQHEVHDEWGADDRYPRWCHDRDGRGCWRGELLPVRADGGRGGRQPRWYGPQWHYGNEPETRAALDLIFSDHFSRSEPGVFEPLRETLPTQGDHYMHLADLGAYWRPTASCSSLTSTPRTGRPKWSASRAAPERRTLASCGEAMRVVYRYVLSNARRSLWHIGVGEKGPRFT